MGTNVQTVINSNDIKNSTDAIINGKSVDLGTEGVTSTVDNNSDYGSLTKENAEAYGETSKGVQILQSIVDEFIEGFEHSPGLTGKLEFFLFKFGNTVDGLFGFKYEFELQRQQGATVLKASYVALGETATQMALVTGSAIGSKALGKAFSQLFKAGDLQTKANGWAALIGGSLIVNEIYENEDLGWQNSVRENFAKGYDFWAALAQKAADKASAYGSSIVANAKDFLKGSDISVENNPEILNFKFIKNGAGNDTIELYNNQYFLESKEDKGNDLFIRKGALTVNSEEQQHSIIDGGTGQDTISYEQVTNLTGGIEIALQDGGPNHGVSTPRGANYGIPLDLLDFIEHAVGTNYNDSIIGSDGDNNLKGANGSDTIIGGKGNDTLIGGVSQTVLTDTGTDVVDYSTAAAGIKADFSKTTAQINDGDGGVDSIYSIEKIIGSGKNDTFYYSDAIQAVSKVSLFDAGAGKDDLIDFSKSATGVTYTLNGKVGNVETDNFEGLIGSKQADNLTGDEKDNLITGGGGDDILAGAGGNDIFDLTSGGSITINDSGAGDLFAIDGRLVTGEATDNEDGTYSLYGYTVTQANGLTITGGGTTVTLSGWSSGDYGITLGLSCPIILDLDKDGLELSTVSSGTGRFDIDADGITEFTGWADASEGFLVVDKNANGAIDNVTEMFGNDGGTTAWEKLKGFDSNKDGKVNSSDTNWAKIKIWKDLNQNYYSEKNEIVTPASVGVYGFGLTNDGYNTSIAGNVVTGRGSWLGSDQKEAGKFYSVLFQTNEERGGYVGGDVTTPPAVDLKILSSYPIIRGHGNVVPSYIALANDATLKTMADTISSLSKTSAVFQIDAIIGDFIIRWAGKDAVTANRGTGVNAKAVAAEEAFRGVDKTGSDSVAAVRPWSAGVLSADEVIKFTTAWQERVSEIKSAIFSQSTFSELFPNSYYSFNQYKTIYNDTVEAVVGRAKLTAPTSSDTAVHSAYWTNIFSVLKTGTGLQLSGTSYFSEAELKAYILSNAKSGIIIVENKVIGSSGNDNLMGSINTDSIEGGAGNDTINGLDGSDTLVGGAGSNQFFGGAEYDTFIISKDTVAVTDTINDFYNSAYSISDIEKIDLSALGSNLALTLQQVGADTTFSVGNHKIILKDTYADNLATRHFVGVSSLSFNNYSKVPTDRSDKISGTANADTIDALYGDDTINGLGGNDSLNGYYGFDSISGDAGNDTLIGSYGGDTLVGGTGNDSLSGGNGLDVLSGGTGNNTFSGGADADLFIIGKDTAAAADIITDFSTSVDAFGKYEKIDLSALGSNLAIKVQGIDSNTRITVGNHTITLNYVDVSKLTLNNFIGVASLTRTYSTVPSYNADSITGTANADTIDALSDNDTIFGLDGNDSLRGDYGNDSLIGGKGNDILSGGPGDDIFVINQGDGLDTIYGSGDNDTVVFGSGITWANLQFSRPSTNDILITVPGGGTVLLKDATSDYLVENFRFSDGSTKTFADVKARLAVGTTGNDSITGFDYSNDTINGLDGNDTILGLSGNDSLIGGKGNDSFSGGSGDDIFVINQGDGIDTVLGSADNDTIAFGAGITWANLQFSRVSASDILITVPGGGTVLLKGATSSDLIENFKFADGSTKTFADVKARLLAGTTGDDSITAFDSSNDTVSGLDGNDTILGYSGNDLLIGGKGNDSLDGARGNDIFVINQGDGIDTINGYLDSDTIVFGAGITWASLQFNRVNTNDVLIAIPGGGSVLVKDGAVSGYGIETFQFADGSTKTFADMQSRMGSVGTIGNDSITGFDSSGDNLNGLDGNDTIFGLKGNDTLTGGKGNDSLDGGRDNDTYVINQGDGIDTIYGSLETDTIEFGAGIAWTNLQFSRVSTNDILITVPGGGTVLVQNGAVNNYGIENYKFADGTIKTFADLQVRMNAATTTGNDSILGFDAGNDTINGGTGDDKLFGLDGNDSLIGGKGNDSLDGGRNNDIYVINQGDGIDTIYGSLETDTIEFGTGITWANLQFSRVSANDVMIAVPGGGTILVQNGAVNNYGIEFFKFADNSLKTFEDMKLRMVAATTTGNDSITGFDSSNDTISGLDGNDTIYGLDGNDSLIGGKGNDLLEGARNNDIFVINQGDGADTVSGYLETDTIIFGTGITWANLQFARINTSDVMITVPGGGSVLVKDGALSSYGIETFQFADGSTKTFADMQVNITSLSTSGNDTITGFDNRNDSLSGAAGNDSIKAYSGDDTILGGAGNDTLVGDAGNDLFVGGAGTDVMTGGSGLDVFDFNSLTESTKAAADTITDFSTTDDKIDLRGLGYTGIMSGAATGTKLGFVYDSVAKDTIITAVGDFKIILDGNKALDASDFIFS